MAEGIILDMPEGEYHRRPELSSTQARRLLESPAKYRHALTVPEAPKAAYDLGTAVHSKVLGVGAATVAIPEDLLAANGAASTKAAKDWIEQARREGKTPVKQAVADEVNAIAEAVLAHPLARFLFEQPGNAEASVFATDPDTGLDLRCRFDFLPDPTAHRQIGVDLKSARDASRVGFARAAADHRYDVQRGHYVDTLSYTGRDLEGFAFVVVEVEPPHLVAVRPLNPQFEEIGTKDARRARRILRECLDTGTWPGYSDGFEDVMPPFWLVAELAEQENQETAA